MIRALRFLRLTNTLLVCGMVALTWAEAQTIAETGDAGSAVSTYQTLFGTGALTTLTGNIGLSTDVDLFRIKISNPATFSARTDVSSGNLNDTQLFLFTLAGAGILANDDISGKLKSLLPAGDSHLSALTAGDYLIAVSGYNFDAFDATSALIFPSSPFTGVYAPNSGVGILDHWSGSSSTGTYTVTFTGASFVTAIPEPAGTPLIAGLGCAAAIWIRSRFRGKSSGRNAT